MGQLLTAGAHASSSAHAGSSTPIELHLERSGVRAKYTDLYAFAVSYSETATRQPAGGRGARERILWAAGVLFYQQGINSTGIEELTTVAHVSKRTFYQHFGS